MTIHNLTIPPPSLAIAVFSFTSFANTGLRYRTKPELASLVQTFIPGEDLLLPAGGFT